MFDNKMMDPLSIETYRILLNQKFSIYFGPENKLEAELVEVADRTRSKDQVQFSLLFNVPEAAPCEQGLYKVEHPEMEKTELFLVPVGKDGEGIKFEAVFNLLVDPGGSKP